MVISLAAGQKRNLAMFFFSFTNHKYANLESMQGKDVMKLS